MRRVSKAIVLHPHTNPTPAHHCAELLSLTIAYITVGFSNYLSTVELINEPLIRLIRVVNWLGPSDVIPL